MKVMVVVVVQLPIQAISYVGLVSMEIIFSMQNIQMNEGEKYI